MPDPIPTDNLYARLGVTNDADTGAIDRAWRMMLKQHHPDIAGALSLELAKRINVAHDWLRDPERRARYDAAVRQREGRRSLSGRATQTATTRPRRSGPRSQPARRATPPDDLDEVFGATGPAIRSFLAQAAALTRDDLDRLSVSEPADPAIDLPELVPPELASRIGALDARLTAACAPGALADPDVERAARGHGRALVLELFLWYYLADPEPLLEQMRRGWESAVGLPRYGPNTVEVTALIERLRHATIDQAEALAAAWAELGDPLPWPSDAWEFDFAALEVSAALARRDAGSAAAHVTAATPAAAARLRNAFGSTAHVTTLRPIFAPRDFARYHAAWGPLGGPAPRRGPGPVPTATVRRA